MRRLAIGFIPLTDAAVLIAAAERGFAAAEGIEIELHKEVSWANVRDKVNIGMLDGAHMLGPLAIAGQMCNIRGFRLADAAYDEGLIIYPRRPLNGLRGDHVLIAPPLIVTRAEIQELLERLDRALATTGAQLPPTAG